MATPTKGLPTRSARRIGDDAPPAPMVEQDAAGTEDAPQAPQAAKASPPPTKTKGSPAKTPDGRRPVTRRQVKITAPDDVVDAIEEFKTAWVRDNLDEVMRTGGGLASIESRIIVMLLEVGLRSYDPKKHNGMLRPDGRSERYKKH